MNLRPLALTALAVLAACGDVAKLPTAADMGAQPVLPLAQPQRTPTAASWPGS